MFFECSQKETVAAKTLVVLGSTVHVLFLRANLDKIQIMKFSVTEGAD